MSAIFDVPPTREQLIEADNQNKAWVTNSYLCMNGIQGLLTAECRKSYNWFNDVIKLKGEMIKEGYIFKVDLLY
jgi:hypothetical protein